MFLCFSNCLRYNIQSLFLSVNCQYFAKLSSLSANETSSRCPNEKVPAGFTSKANDFKLHVRIKLKQLKKFFKSSYYILLALQYLIMYSMG